MEQNIPDFLKDAFPESNFEHLHFDDDAATAHSVTTPQNEPDMEDSHGGSRSEFEFELEAANREEETKNCSENNRDFSLDEHSTKVGSALCSSYHTDENKTQTKQLSLHDEECKEDESEMHTGVSKEQAEDVSVIDQVLPVGTHIDLETMSTLEETTSHLPSYQMEDKPENESSTSEEDETEPDSDEEHSLDDNKLNCFSVTQSTPQDWPVESVEDEIKEFTEEDHEHHGREEEALADYPSDLSQSGDSSEGQPNLKHTKLGLGCSYEVENLEEPPLSYQVVTSREDDGVQRKGESVDPVDMLMYEDLYVETLGKSDDDILLQTKPETFGDDKYNRSDFGISENFQSNSSESYKNEKPDYDSDISSDGDNCKSQEEPDFTSHTILDSKNTALQKQKHTFNEDFAPVWNSIEHEVVTGTCDVGLSSISGAQNESQSRNELQSIKPKPNSEHSEDTDFGENINTLLPGTFWSVVDEDNLKLDEYDWDINGEEVICDEEDNFLEELENEAEESERDWEKEKARIDAFNKYYDSADNEENMGRSHKVTFCLVPESTQYEEDSDSSEEDLSCISKLHATESSSVQQDHKNEEESCEPQPPVSDIGENISTFLMDKDNVKFDEFDNDINEEEFCEINSSKVFADDEDDFLEKLKMEIEREMARTEFIKYYEESFEEQQHEITDKTQKSRLHQQFSQNDENNDSSEQESNTEDDTTNVLKTEDQSDSDEPHERRLYTGRHRVLLKGLQKADKQLKEHPKRNKCLVVMTSVLAVSLATAVGLLSYCWATDSLDLLNLDGSWIFDMIQNRK